MKRTLYGIILTCFLFSLATAQSVSSVEGLVLRAEQAGVDRELLDSFRERSVDLGIPESDVVRLLTPVVSVAEEGLPSDQVLRKALEGMAKRVPPQHIVNVLSALNGHTRDAGRILDPWIRQPEVARSLEGESRNTSALRNRLVESLAQAFTQEVPVETVELILREIPQGFTRRHLSGDDLETVFGVLIDLPTSREDPAGTATLILSALEAGYERAELRQLPAALKKAQQRGNLPAHVIAKQTTEKIKGGSRAADVLGDLSRGAGPKVQPPANKGKGAPPGVGREERGGPPADRSKKPKENGPPGGKDKNNPPGKPN